MAVRRYVNTDLWEDPYIQSLRPLQRYLFIYLITNPKCNIAGVYEITTVTIKRLTGLTDRQIAEYMQKFTADRKMVYRDNWLVLANAPKHQEWQSSKSVAAGIEHVLLRAPWWVLSGIRYGSIPYAYPEDRIPAREGDPPPTLPPPSGEGPFSPGEGLRSYSDLTRTRSYSDGEAVDKLLSGVVDNLGTGTPKGRG